MFAANRKSGTGYGTRITWGTSTAMNDLEVTDISVTLPGREVYETTHYGSGLPGAAEMGNATYVPGDVAGGAMIDVEANAQEGVVLPMTADVETVTVTWPVPTGYSSGVIWSFSGCMVGTPSVSPPMKGIKKVKYQIHVCGPIALTAAVAA